MKRSQLESMDLGALRTAQAVLLAVLPSRLKTAIYKLFGAQIGRGVSIGFGSFILADSFSKIRIGDYSKIRQFTLIACSEVSIGPYSEIAMFVWIWGAGKLRIADKCYVGPRCVINLRRNDFTMGSYAGLGPGSMVYTHGQWLPYTQGWPRTYGDVTLEDYAWVPAKVLLLPGVKVGTKSIIGSGAVVTKEIPPYSFAGGVPAKVISPVKEVMEEIDEQELFRRIVRIAEDLPNFFGFKIISNEINGTSVILTVGTPRRHWKIIASTPQGLEGLPIVDSSENTVVLTSGRPPQHILQSKMVWFDLVNLECGPIRDNFSLQIWEFLRATWCVTCSINDAK
jgi:acetyltransferase-like isoleucine patch superfamily enzyme